MPNFAGRCVCGRVSYSGSGEPIFSGICHCRTCQHATGSAFATVIAFPEANVTVQGSTKTFDGVGDSGNATHRRFCPNCGASVALTADLMPGVVMLAVGTLDDPSWVNPAMQIYCDSAQPWVQLGGGMQKFAKMPMPA